MVDVNQSTVSAAISVDGAQVGERPAQIFVLIKNEGTKPLPDMMAILRAPAGTTIAPPDELFGVAEKRQRTGKMRAGQIIRYKIALKSRIEFRGGVLEFELRDPDLAPMDPPYFAIRTELLTDRG